MYNDVLYLGDERITIDDIGNQIQSIEYGDYKFCEVKSVTRTEFYNASQSGYKPEIVFVLPDYYDYNNEHFVKYNDVEYQIIRTYRTGTEIELIAQRYGEDND